jgi:hypothetical protein
MRDQQVLCTKTSELRACKHDRFFLEALRARAAREFRSLQDARFYAKRMERIGWRCEITRRSGTFRHHGISLAYNFYLVHATEAKRGQS